MNPSTTARAALLATVCMLAAGCRALPGTLLVAGREPPDAADTASARRASLVPRTLPVEVRFVRHDPHDPDFAAALWDHVDEQALDPGLRRRLQANGLRAGVVTGRLPADVATRLEPQAAVDPSTPEDVGLHRVLRLLPGKRAEVVSTAGIAELVLMEHGAEGVRGATYRDATALVTLRAWPDADGHVRVHLVPEVKHGAVQRSWVGEEGMFRLETGQARRDFDDLGITARLPSGGLLVVGVADSEGASVGDVLLRDPSPTAGARLLLVQPLATSADPLFAASDSDGPAGGDR